MDRDAFLAACAADPNDDTARLVYADWLDENGPDSDAARACAEFIRLSCRPGKSTGVMPQAGYRWITHNWHRLLPSFVALHTPYPPDFVLTVVGRPRFAIGPEGGGPLPASERTGRRVWTRPLLGRNDRSGRPYCGTVNLTFWKGFVADVLTFSPWVTEVACPAIVADSPLLHPGRNFAKVYR